MAREVKLEYTCVQCKCRQARRGAAAHAEQASVNDFQQLQLTWGGPERTPSLQNFNAEETLKFERELSIHCEHYFQGPLCDNSCVCCRAKIRGLFFILFLACAAILAPAACACGALCVCALTPPLSFSTFALPSHPPRARYTYPIAVSDSIIVSYPKSYLSEQVWMDGKGCGDFSCEGRALAEKRWAQAAAKEAVDEAAYTQREVTKRLNREKAKAAEEEAKRVGAAAAEEEAKRVAAAAPLCLRRHPFPCLNSLFI